MLGRRAARRVLVILAFGEVVRQRCHRDPDPGLQVLVNPHVQRARQQHIDQHADDDERGGQHADVEQRQAAANALNPQLCSIAHVERISRATVGANQLQQVPVVYLAAQALDVDLDQVGHRVEAVVPDVFGNVRTANDVTPPASEILEQGVFLRRQLNHPTGPLDASGTRVDRQILESQDR